MVDSEAGTVCSDIYFLLQRNYVGRISFLIRKYRIQFYILSRFIIVDDMIAPEIVI